MTAFVVTAPFAAQLAAGFAAVGPDFETTFAVATGFPPTTPAPVFATADCGLALGFSATAAAAVRELSLARLELAWDGDCDSGSAAPVDEASASEKLAPFCVMPGEACGPLAAFDFEMASRSMCIAIPPTHLQS